MYHDRFTTFPQGPERTELKKEYKRPVSIYVTLPGPCVGEDLGPVALAADVELPFLSLSIAIIWACG